MKTTLEQWRMFKAVVEYGSFAKAAEAIHKSQSTINTAVHKLQESLGIQLLEVDGRKTVLTETGKLLLRRGKLVLDEVFQIESLADELAKGTETHFTVAVDSIYPSENIYSSFSVLSEKFPSVRVELVETILSGSNELLLDGKVSIAISARVPDNFIAEHICDVEFIAVASPNHNLFSTKASITHNDLKLHRQIVVRDSAIKNKVDSGWLQAEQRWTVTNMATSIDLIQRGYGYAWLPTNKIESLLQENKLKPLLLDKGASRLVQLFLITADEDKLGPAAKCFIKNIRSIN
ncbi:MAG: LysR family transcriptional regulator [Cellvibrionaceae bacterium]